MADTPPTQDEQRQAAVVANHLPEGYTASFDGINEAPQLQRSGSDVAQSEEQSSLRLQGGDLHRDIFKIDARNRLMQRAQTFSHPHRPPSVSHESMTAREQQEPQGFRRQHMMQRQRAYTSVTMPVTRNFVEFLDLYGAFAGEDLAESDDEAIQDDEEEEEPSERRPLLQRRKTSRIPKKGDAGVTKTFFTLLKAFIGTGIMFLPKAFNNGGILFSSMTLVSVALISMLAFHLLLECRARYSGGYGELGLAIVGPKMRALILASVTFSQIGFVCAGLVFVADNMHSCLEAITNGANPLSTAALIGLQAVVIVPLTFIRNISKLGPAALLADVFIFIGLFYIWHYDISAISTHGIDPSVQLFNPDSYTLTIGSAIFTFEGIGLILPIQSSMKDPQKFEWLLAAIMLINTIIYTSVGALCYATFGSRTQIEVIDNYPQSSRLVNAVQFMYALAILVGNPVQLFPAVRILEGKIFKHLSGKKDLVTKWKKNAFRTTCVGVCVAISIAGSANLDRFVALIGSFACVPLVYIYPPYLHYKGVAETRWAKGIDIALMALGFVGMIYTTFVTIVKSFM